MLTIWNDSRYQKLLVAFVAGLIFCTYAYVSPGGEFFVIYRNMVLNPEELVSLFGFPITYNPPWLAPILAPFITMPGRGGLVLFIAGSIALFLTAASLLNGRPLLLLMSAQLSWILWWGQIEALSVVGLAIAWYALKNGSWKWMVLAIVLVALKPQIGILPLAAIWWWSGKDRWKSLAAFLLIVFISIAIYGPWPYWFLTNMLRVAEGEQYRPWNSSIGLWALPLLIPALWMKLSRYERVMAFTATGLLISPYMPYYSTIVMFSFAVPLWTAPFALIGYFSNILGTGIAWNGIAFLPLSVLAWLYFPAARGFFMRTAASEAARRFAFGKRTGE